MLQGTTTRSARRRSPPGRAPPRAGSASQLDSRSPTPAGGDAARANQLNSYRCRPLNIALTWEPARIVPGTTVVTRTPSLATSARSPSRSRRPRTWRPRRGAGGGPVHEVHGGREIRRRLLLDGAGGDDARVRDQHVHRPDAPGDLVEEPAHRLRVGDVADGGRHLPSGGLEIRGGGLEHPLVTPADGHARTAPHRPPGRSRDPACVSRRSPGRPGPAGEYRLARRRRARRSIAAAGAAGRIGRSPVSAR